MRVLNYLELEGRMRRCGIGTAAANQRRALSAVLESDRTSLDPDAVDVITSPWRDRSSPGAVAAGLPPPPSPRDFDLAHCNLIGPGSVAVASLARRRDVPLVLHAHVTAEDFAGSFRGSDRVAPALRRYLRWFYSRADLVLCPSRYTGERIEDYPIDAPIHPLTNGVDLESLAGFEAFREEYRARFDLDGTVVFTVGNVFERKGLDDFCRLARELADADEDFEFAWFGPYDTGLLASPAVDRWLNEHPDNVTFTGWIEDKRGAFGAGDVYVFPTREENQGIAALEAMACGKPVVLRDLPVFREYYTDGEDCLMCETRAEFREAIERVASNPELARRLGENARETANAHRLERVGEELLGIYREQLGR